MPVQQRLRKNAQRMMAAALLAALALGTQAVTEPAAAQGRSPWPGGVWSPGPAAYGTAQDLQLSVTMSDGAVLKADVSYPTDPATGQRASGTFPVIMTQTPYLGTDPKSGDYFVQRGYIFVTAYVRGTTTSGGTFSFFSQRDAQDGAELVQWASKTLWNSNGTVGLQGGSWAGLDQFYTVAALGTGSPVKAMVATCMGAEFYRETYFASGIPTQTINFPSVLGYSVGGTTAAAYGAALVSDVKAGGPTAYDGAFWQLRTPGNYVQQVAATGIPILLWSSDGDIYAQSSLELYAYLQNASNGQPIYGPMPRSQTPNGRYQIIISQGGHCAGQSPQIQLEWFDTWLKGQATGIDQTANPLHVQELVSNRWLSTSQYPVVPTYTKQYLDVAGSLSPGVPASAGQEVLSWAQPGAISTATYDTPAFPNGATLAGPFSGSLYASSTTKNLELIATLQIIGSDGTVKKLTSGAVLGSMVTSDPQRSWVDGAGTPVRPYGLYDTDRYVPAGAVQRYDFAISPRFARIPPGSKLRTVLTTQTPSSSCGGVLGTDPCVPTAPQVASLSGSVVTIYHSSSTPSSINLPLLPANCWRSSYNPSNPTIPYWTNPTISNPASPCQQ